MSITSVLKDFILGSLGRPSQTPFKQQTDDEEDFQEVLKKKIGEDIEKHGLN
jgi:hypothetical protein